MILPSGNIELVDFRYEQLPEFCFVCDRVGHVFKVCSFVDQAAKQASKKPNGTWLQATNDFITTRASSPKRSNCGGMSRHVYEYLFMCVHWDLGIF